MINTQEHINNLVTAAYYRELEIYQYQINIDNYTMLLQTLPTYDWPQHFTQYRNMSVGLLPNSMSDEDVTQIGDLQYRDRLRELIRTEKAEQSKVIRIRDVLKIQIGAEYDELIAAKRAADLQNQQGANA